MLKSPILHVLKRSSRIATASETCVARADRTVDRRWPGHPRDLRLSLRSRNHNVRILSLTALIWRGRSDTASAATRFSGKAGHRLTATGSAPADGRWWITVT